MVSPAGLGRAPNRAPSNGCIGPSGFAVTQGPDNRKTVGHRHQIGGVGTWTTITHPPPALATSSCGEHRGARLLARTRPEWQPRQQRGRLRGRLPVPRDARQQRPRTPSATLPGTAARWRTTVFGPFLFTNVIGPTPQTRRYSGRSASLSWASAPGRRAAGGQLRSSATSPAAA